MDSSPDSANGVRPIFFFKFVAWGVGGLNLGRGTVFLYFRREVPKIFFAKIGPQKVGLPEPLGS